MIKRILCPVDFSETSEFALDYAINLGRELGAEVHVLHVYEIPIYSFPDGAIAAGAEYSARVSDAAQKSIRALAERKKAKLVTHVTEGLSAPAICDFARESRADWIVMGTHGRTGLRHFALGSIAERVVRRSTVPVLTIRHPENKS